MNDSTRFVPKEMNHPFFMDPQNTKADPSSVAKYFPQECLFFANKEGTRPWTDPANSIPMVLALWEDQKGKIESSFRERDKNGILLEMKLGISLFMRLLFWSNGLPVALDKFGKLKELSIKPMNCTERLHFLMERPCLFHSFIQLGGLFEEQHKHFLTRLAKEKRSFK